MRKINEIFYSLQGEGHHEGYPSVFVRFSGCNLNCAFCDTQHQDGIYMDDDSIIRAINLYKADWVVLTGGEPSMFIDDEFIHLLKRATGKKIAIETNGTYPVPEAIDWVTVSPKTGFEGAGDIPLRVRHASEIKVVDLGQDLDQYFNLDCRTPETIMYLQPCYVEDNEQFRKNIMSTVNRVLSNPKWTLSVQLHRFLNIP